MMSTIDCRWDLEKVKNKNVYECILGNSNCSTVLRKSYLYSQVPIRSARTLNSFERFFLLILVINCCLLELPIWCFIKTDINHFKAEFGCSLTICQIVFEDFSHFWPLFHFTMYVLEFLEIKKPILNTSTVTALVISWPFQIKTI